MTFLKNKTILIRLALRLIIFLASGYLSFSLRFELNYFNNYISKIFFIVAIQFTIFYSIKFFYLYFWGRTLLYSSEALKVTIFSHFLTSVISSYFFSVVIQYKIPRSLPFLISFIALSTELLFFQIYKVVYKSFNYRKRRVHIAILGNLEEIQQLISQIINDVNNNWRPVIIFLNSKSSFNPSKINGIKIKDLKNLDEILKNYQIKYLVVNNPEIEIKGSFNLEYIRLICTKNGTELKFLPNSRALSTDEYYQQFARSYSQQELIGKTSLKPDLSLLTPLLKGKSVLITGAGGSIGSELARQVFQCAPKKLFLLDRDETKLLELELSFQKYRLDTKIELILADIREEQNIGFILKYIKPDIIFHAAALKHLNMLEKYPLEAYKTNVIGTYNLLRNSIENNCSIFVNISSDKASDPISVLGLSKLYSEKLVSSFANIHSNQKILSVRFGNVFGSQGSFIHTFKQQIIDGGPITITHPKVARYFMTLQEAVFLVVQAAVVGESGQTLLLTMGEQILIQDIATKLIKNSGKKIEIIYTGLNHGEKLDETLIGKNEKIISKYDKNIFAIKIPSKNLSEIYFEWKNESIVTNLRHLCEVNMYQSFGHQN